MAMREGYNHDQRIWLTKDGWIELGACQLVNYQPGDSHE